jgi:uncharacterized protein (DUF427 family)
MNIQNTTHRITITTNPRQVRVRFGDQILVDTAHGLILKEGGLPPVHYLPRADADMAALVATSRKTRCPFKGEASYFSIADAGQRGENAVWSYEDPIVGVEAIAGHLAFYADRVAIEEF